MNSIIDAIEGAMAIGEQDDAIALGTGSAMRSLMAQYPDRSRGRRVHACP